METPGQEGNEIYPRPADPARTFHSAVLPGAWLSQGEVGGDTSLGREVRPSFPPLQSLPLSSREPSPPTRSSTLDTFISLL